MILAAIALAGAQAVPALPAPAVTVLKADRLFDARTERTMSPGVVTVSGGRIIAVGSAIAPCARVIELGDSTLLPGLIVAHTHISDRLTERVRYRD